MSPNDRLPRPVAAIFRALLPLAEREEVLADLAAEFRHRARTSRAAAHVWAWRQAIFSLPALTRRIWWRGMTGFEPQANRLRPGGPMVESWIMDLRFAARRLMRRPAYALLAVLTLGMGAGGTAAISGIGRTLLLDPLPVAAEEEIGVFWFNGSWREQEFLRLRPDFPGFEQVAAYRPDDQTLELPGQPLRLLPGVAVSAELFDVLGTPALLGRTFRAGEDLQGSEPVVVLSHAVWQDLGGRPDVVGSSIRLGGTDRTVVGVMPRGFWFPAPDTRIWTAAQMDPQNRAGRYTLIGRAAPGQPIAHMDGPLRALTSRLAANFQYPNPQWDKTKNPSVTPVREFLVGDVRPALVATLAAMAVILLIACANVAALMLGQLDARSTELAVRAALGADRRRLFQQLVMEALLVGLLAGSAGVLLAVLGFGLLVTSLPLGGLAETARLDWTVFWAGMGAALVASVLIAIVPGLALGRRGRMQATMAAGRTGGIQGRGGRLEGALVVGQAALAVLLAAGAGLLIRSVANLRAIDPGVETRGLVIIDVTMPGTVPMEMRRQWVENMLVELRALPGVRISAAAQKLPLRGSGDNWGFTIRGRTDVTGVTTAFRMVTRDYFSTLGLPIVRGSGFQPSDRPGSAPVVVINEAMAAKFFPGEDPVGRIISTGFGEAGERIIGVVGNAAEANLTDGPVPARYMLYDHLPYMYTQLSFVLRTDDDRQAAGVIRSARSTIGRSGSPFAVQETTTMQALFDRAVGPAGQLVWLLSLLAGLALILGAVGVYGVISHYVARRSRDYGIQIALGQEPSRIVRQVVGRGAGLVAAGSILGIAAAVLATRTLAALLHGVAPTDPLSLTAAVAALLLVGALAAAIPARRASLTDPAIVLKES